MQVLTDHAADGAGIRAASDALAAGGIVVLPTDTVYGICVAATDPDAYRRMLAVKGRDDAQPTAVVFHHPDALLEALPELSVRGRFAVHALLPGPWTLVLSVSEDHRFAHLCGDDPTRLGVRVPGGALALPPVAATSANATGEPEAATVAELPRSIAEHVDVAIDRGPLPPGRASTVLDLTAWERGGDIAVLRDPGGRTGLAAAALLAAPAPDAVPG